MSSKTVIVTGFGLFRDYKVNASWEVARALPETGLAKELNVNLITINIPVSYKDVDQIVPTLWDQHKPTVSCVICLVLYVSLQRKFISAYGSFGSVAFS